MKVISDVPTLLAVAFRMTVLESPRYRSDVLEPVNAADADLNTLPESIRSQAGSSSMISKSPFWMKVTGGTFFSLLRRGSSVILLHVA